MLRGKKRARKRTRERAADGFGCCEAPDATLRKIRRRASLAVGAARCLLMLALSTAGVVQPGGLVGSAASLCSHATLLGWRGRRRTTAACTTPRRRALARSADGCGVYGRSCTPRRPRRNSVAVVRFEDDVAGVRENLLGSFETEAQRAYGATKLFGEDAPEMLTVEEDRLLVAKAAQARATREIAENATRLADVARCAREQHEEVLARQKRERARARRAINAARSSKQGKAGRKRVLPRL